MNLKEVKFFTSPVRIVNYFVYRGCCYFEGLYKDKRFQCGYDIYDSKDMIDTGDFNRYVSLDPIDGMTTEDHLKLKETLCEMIELIMKNKSLVRWKYGV